MRCREEDEWKANQAKESKKIIRREREKTKKRKQREWQKECKITEGLRSPGGTKWPAKRAVRVISISL